ncbi:MAG: helix-hairpin-helix domain-containing protein [Anaerolineales bacterium]|nr:MAG: helix-hairpin-helix domain-containing protein [Anaerolineales bacterium]
MDTLQKIRVVGRDMHLESDSENDQICAPVVGGRQLPARPVATIPISEVALPGGRKMKVVKSMLTTACERNCNYCPFRAGRSKMQRITIKPDEMAQVSYQAYRQRLVEGLFLSSGIIKGGVTTQDKLIDTAEILRNKLGFRGYLHLKIMPGADRDQVRRSMQLADRISVNLEGANTRRLATLAPMKKFAEELLAPLKWAQEIRVNEAPASTWNGRWASSVTQFVVGGADETDVELVSTSEYLYHELKLKRTYYSAFSPIIDTPLENHRPENPWREHRLYQASFLLRDYGFAMEELPFNQSGNLPLNKDPKTAWAEQTLLHKPVEVNTATREQLLLVPGIGPKSADAILRARRLHAITSLEQLKELGIVPKRSAPFVLLNGRQPSFQPRLMDMAEPTPQLRPRFPG